jgi:predicted DNA-binding WGR domain protein
LYNRLVATRRFELIEGSSSKFWEIAVSGTAYTVTYGRIGTAGQSKTKKVKDAAKEAAALVAEKLKKGYAEIKKGGAAAKQKPVAAKKAALDTDAIQKAVAKGSPSDRKRIEAAFAALGKIGYVTTARGAGTDAKDAWDAIEEHADTQTGEFPCAFWPGEANGGFDAKGNLTSPILLFYRGDTAPIGKALKAAGVTFSGDYLMPRKDAVAKAGKVKASELAVGDTIQFEFQGRPSRGTIIGISPFGDELGVNMTVPSGGFVSRYFKPSAKVERILRK